MPILRTIAEANQALLPYVQRVNTLLGTDTALRRIAPLMAAAGDPHEKLKIIHVAGTSGKTSTAYFTAAILQASGKKIGLTVSPHVDSVTERVQIDGQPLPEAEFCRELGDFLDIAATLAEPPSYFELLYSFSFWVFAKQGVEYAVVETGMGGLWDPTNIARRPDKVCIITDIGYDHMHILGATIPEIARQKAGIIHPGNQVFMYRQTAEIDQIFTETAQRQSAELHWLEPSSGADLDFPDAMPGYQRRNWLLALRTADYIRLRDDVRPATLAQLSKTQMVQVPGRMDSVKVGSKTIVMDGAHNAQKMTAFLDSFRQMYPDARPTVLLALKEGKEPIDIVPLIAAITDHVIITTFDTSQDMPAKSISPDKLMSLFLKTDIPVVPIVEMIPRQEQAYQALLVATSNVVIITGSFYLLSQLRQRESLQ